MVLAIPTRDEPPAANRGAIDVQQHEQDATKKVRRILVQRLEGLQRAGVTHMIKPRKSPQVPGLAQSPERPHSHMPPPATGLPPGVSRAAQPSTATSIGGPLAGASRAAYPLPPEAPAATDRLPALEILRGEVAACTRCRELAETRTQTVFGVGNPQARLCFLGEAPGADEDRQGEPFVGRAGQLLTKIIEACTLRREEVYILNVLKCRPPGNRNPLPDEAANCRGFLERQLAIIRPEFICCLGAVAAQNLLATEQSIGRLRGRLHEYQGIKVLCTYHPAYLLRNPEAKKDVWQDMQFLMREMGIEVRK
jgi:uracil-DNA glycosylase